MIKIENKNYEWELDDLNNEWNLSLSTFYENEYDLPFANFPIMEEIMEDEDNRSYQLRVKQSKPTKLRAWYYGTYPKYKGKTDSELILINFIGCNDLYYVTEAHLLKGRFKTGRMPTHGGIYTEDLGEFKDDLTNYFKQTQELGWPQFGEYLGNFFTNSNLQKDVANSFKDLIE